MADKNIVQVPDYLLDALKLEQATGSTDVFAGDEQRMPRLRRIELPQRTSMKHGGEFGKLFVSGLEDGDEGEYITHLDFLLVEPLVFEANNAEDWMAQNNQIKRSMPIGARTMWSFDESGRRVTTSQTPVCSSNNGFEVWPQYRDMEVFDYRTKRKHKIGWRMDVENGQMTRVANSCIGCPFAEWVSSDESHDGKKYDPMCRKTFSYLIWDIDREEFMQLKAVNMGMQLSLWGHSGKVGRRYDGEPFAGIRHYFSHNGEIEVNGKRTPTFVNRPEGKPSVENPSAPVYAVRMTATLNNFDPPTSVPHFTVLDGKSNVIPLVNAKKMMVDTNTTIEAGTRQIESENYALYIRSVSEVYIGDDYRNRLMAMGLANKAPTFSQPMPALSTPSNPELPASVTTDENFDSPFGFSEG